MKSTINKKVIEALQKEGVTIEEGNSYCRARIAGIRDIPVCPRGLYLKEIYAGDVLNGEVIDAFIIFDLGRKKHYWETTLIDLLSELNGAIVEI